MTVTTEGKCPFPHSNLSTYPHLLRFERSHTLIYPTPHSRRALCPLSTCLIICFASSEHILNTRLHIALITSTPSHPPRPIRRRLRRTRRILPLHRICRPRRGMEPTGRRGRDPPRDPHSIWRCPVRSCGRGRPQAASGRLSIRWRGSVVH